MTESADSALPPSIQQHTLAREIPWSGFGDDGHTVALVMHPAEPDSGIRFRRQRVARSRAIVAARWERVIDPNGAVTLANDDGVTVRGVAVLLAALRALGIDNALIEVSARQLPATVPDYFTFLELVAAAGVTTQASPRKALRLDQVVEVRDSFGFAAATPAPGLCVRLGVANADRSDDTLLVSGAVASDLLEPANGWPHRPLANCDGQRPLWDIQSLPPLLRARIIEIIGHLSLAGAPLLGHWRGYRSSPALHHTLLRAIMMRRAVTPTTVDAMLKSRDSSDEPPADPLRLLSAPHESYYH